MLNWKTDSNGNAYASAFTSKPLTGTGKVTSPHEINEITAARGINSK